MSHFHGDQDRLLKISDGKECVSEPTEMLKLLSTSYEVGCLGTSKLGGWDHSQFFPFGHCFTMLHWYPSIPC